MKGKIALRGGAFLADAFDWLIDEFEFANRDARVDPAAGKACFYFVRGIEDLKGREPASPLDQPVYTFAIQDKRATRDLAKNLSPLSDRLLGEKFLPDMVSPPFNPSFRAYGERDAWKF